MNGSPEPEDAPLSPERCCSGAGAKGNTRASVGFGVRVAGTSVSEAASSGAGRCKRPSAGSERGPVWPGESRVISTRPCSSGCLSGIWARHVNVQRARSVSIHSVSQRRGTLWLMPCRSTVARGRTPGRLVMKRG